MARPRRKKKNSLKTAGFTILGSVIVIVGFVVVFLVTNNIDISLNTQSANDKYPAKAFVKKRSGKTRSEPQVGRSLKSATSVGITTNEGLTANIEFDKSKQQINLSIRDHNDKPMGRLQVVAHISKIGSKSSPRPVRMIETSAGKFGSESLDLRDGGWILMVSAYNFFNPGYNTLLFHSEQPIFLGQTKKRGDKKKRS